MSGKRFRCWKRPSAFGRLALLRAWFKYGGPLRGHAYLCVRCGAWHYTSKHRDVMVRRPNGAQRRARRKRLDMRVARHGRVATP